MSANRADTTARPGRSPLAWSTDEVLLGCDYNPEQWDPAVWHEDVALMREAGVSLVAVNVFGWSDVEPRPGTYDFSRLDAVVDLLHENGIGVNLGTGTSSPPPWLYAAHPEVLPVMADGTTRWPGGRQAWCPSSPVFRERALALVEQVARRYGDHPAVRLWHVSNELGCHNAHCWCDVSGAAFRRWLEERYGTVDALNRAWGTSFWSQRYTAWDEVLPPRLTVSTPNPSQVLDFRRFSSDELLGHYRAEAEVVRRHSAIPVTTNFMVTAHQRDMDYFAWAPHVDVVANDHYLDHRLADPVAELAFCADTTRGIAGGRPWLLMEHSTSAVNWQPVNVAKLPGEMLRTSLTHVARGADAVCFFQWRASAQGAEKFHSALVPHAGTDTALWREVLELGATLRSIGEVAGSTVRNDVALVHSYEAWWAADGENQPSAEVRHLDQVLDAYRALRAAGLGVDVVPPGAPLDGYRMVVVPHLYLVRDDDAAVIDRFVADGGHAVVGFFSGVVDEDDRVRLGGYPGAFRDLLGVLVEEFHPLQVGATVGLDDGSTARLWTERLRTTTAEPVVRHVDGPVAGTPAVTRNQHGAGTAWYVATALEHKAATALVARVAESAGVTPLPGAGEGVEVVRRVDPADGGRSWLFVVNHRPEDVEVAVAGHELTRDERVETLRVPAGAVRVLREG
ncbi:beta-galactosidase [Cellulomonas carbonis]|uniref:Beta-galactosidase n=1 Tax=Cellulomonas carbonis T26 TaxID=947969 RepID=A0A0A0BX94_9CELL|nr:beta-galactosidase [Cellulomonas carbonis]KGM12292.1 beta-galactosidase [Cellulomonas carbonis T26]GGC01460.1 beta-galactosidase [Cellulomonas carbonis]